MNFKIFICLLITAKYTQSFLNKFQNYVRENTNSIINNMEKEKGKGKEMEKKKEIEKDKLIKVDDEEWSHGEVPWELFNSTISNNANTNINTNIHEIQLFPSLPSFYVTAHELAFLFIQ